MADGRGSETIELEVKDFGPIVEAKVDLRPFTVFVGPSNTGKSYLAILIYALHRFFGGNQWRPSGLDGPWRYGKLMEIMEESLEKTDRTTLANWADQTFGDKSSKITHIDAHEEIIEAIRNGLTQQADGIVAQIHRSFGAGNVNDLVREGRSSSARIRFRTRGERAEGALECELTIGTSAPVLKAIFPRSSQIAIMDDDLEQVRRASREWLNHNNSIYSDDDSEFEMSFEHMLFSSFVGSLSIAMCRNFSSQLNLPAYYMPADRTGVMHAHATVVSAVIQGASRVGLRQDPPAPALSGVLADFLDRLILLGRPGLPGGGRRPDRGAGIEDAILDGVVRVERGAVTGYPGFFYRPRGWKRDLPLMNASSMVSELAPVVLFLRHAVEPGDLLIVEEPESHLHPAKQVEFTRQLAQLVQAGVRVLITTHSEWILEELANIVQRSGLSEDDRKALPNGEVALRPDQVGAWLFEPKKRPKGSVVKEIPLDDNGTWPTGFDDVALALYNNWAEIASRKENAE